MTKSFRMALEVYVFAFAFLLASRPLSDGDFWFHLKTGEYILRNGLIPKQEIFSFTNYGSPWIAHGWLSGALFYAVYSKLGLYTLMFLFALLATFAFWIIFKRSKGHIVIRAFATLLAVLAVMPNLGVRPRVFSLLFASIFLALLESLRRDRTGRAFWLLIPLMVLWVNFHGGFVIGLILIVLTMVGILLDGWIEGTELSNLWPPLRTLFLVLVGCVVAVVVNPYGLKMYTLPLEVMQTPVFQAAVVDFLPPNFHQREMVPFALLALLAIASLALSPRRIKPSRLLLFIATFFSALTTQRNILIFSLVAAPLLAEHAQSWLESTRIKLFNESRDLVAKPDESRVLSVLLLLPLLLFAIQLKRTVYVAPRQETSKVPMKAVEYMKEHQIVGNTVTVPNIWGGYLIWALPSNPVYIDGRNAYPPEFFEEYVRITSGLTDWCTPFARHRVRHAIVSKSSRMARELSDSKAWAKVYEDELALVFTKQVSDTGNASAYQCGETDRGNR